MKLIKENCPTYSKVHAVITLEEAGPQSQQSGQRVRTEAQERSDCVPQIGPDQPDGGAGENDNLWAAIRMSQPSCLWNICLGGAERPPKQTSTAQCLIYYHPYSHNFL